MSFLDCVDENGNCQNWANVGECDKNPNYMLEKCKWSCNACASGNDWISFLLLILISTIERTSNIQNTFVLYIIQFYRLFEF